MNNKQIACVVLSMIIALMAYGTLTMNKKLTAAKEGKEEASRKAGEAKSGRMQAEIQLKTKKDSTQALRDYLAEWQPYLMMTSTEAEAQRIFNQKLKDGSLIIFQQGFEPVKHSFATIPGGLRARLVFEDDYHRMLTWLGSLESSLPTSRVSNCRITKGGKGNEVKMELSAEVPLAAVTTKK